MHDRAYEPLLNFNTTSNRILHTKYLMMFLKRECWILICLFFFEERQINGLSRENRSGDGSGSSTPKELDRLLSNESSSSSSSFLSNLFNFCGNILKKDYELAYMGLKLQREGKYDDALYCFTKAINKKPKDPVPYFRLRGDCYREMNKKLEALDDYDRVIKLNTDGYTTADRIVFSRLLFDVTRFENAVKEMKLTGNAAEIASLGSDLIRQSQYNEALDCFNESIRLNHNVADYYRQRAYCLAKLPSFPADKRIEDLRNVVALEPNMDNRQLLVKALFDAAEYNDAIQEAIVPNDFDGLVVFGDLLASRQDYTNAIRFYDAAIEKKPTMAEYYKQRGRCYLRMQMYDKAIHDFIEILRSEPNNRQRSVFLKDALLYHKKMDECFEGSLPVLSASDLEDLGNRFYMNAVYDIAIRCFTEALNRRPSGLAYRLRGSCYVKMQNFSAAISDNHQMLKMEPYNKQFKLHLMNTLRDYGKIDEVVEETIAILSTQDLENLGNQFFADGKLDVALLYCNKALNRNRSKSAYILRGKCYLEMKNFGAAISDLQAALEMFDSGAAERSENCMKLLRRALSEFDSFGDVPDDTLNLLNDSELQILGSQFQMKNMFEEALRCYSAAVAKDSTNSNFYKVRANFYLKTNDKDKAVQDFLQVARINPEDENNWNSVRGLLYEAGRFDELIEYSATFGGLVELLNLCDELYFMQKLDEALRCYTIAIDKNPTNIQLYQRRGNFFWGTHNLEMAFEDFLFVVRRDPSNKETWASFSQILFQSGRFEELINYTTNLSDVTELANLGDQFSSRGYVNEALRCYTEAINKNPQDPEYYKRRAKGNLRMSNLDEAILDLIQVVDLNPHDEGNWSALSSLLFEHERYDQLIEYTLLLSGLDELEELCNKLRSARKMDEAVRCYAYADKASPSDPEFYTRRANFYVELDKKDMAVFDLLTVSRIDPANRENWTLLIQILIDAGRVKELYTFIEDATPELSDDQLAEMGEKILSLEKFDLAVHCYTQAILKNPYNPEFYKRRGDGYARIKYLDMAEFDFIQAVELDPEDTESLASLFTILFENGKYDELINYTIPLAGMDELAKLGDKFMAASNYEKALRSYNEGIMKYPVDAAYYNKRGLCHWKLQNSECAISDWKEAIRLQPNNLRYRVDLINVLIQDKRFNEAEKALANASQMKVIFTPEDEALLDTIKQKIEVERLKELTDYLKELVSRDAAVQTNRIRENSPNYGFDNESYNKIQDVEFDRNSCIEELTRAELVNRTRVIETSRSMAMREPPDYLQDSITYDLFKDPVITPTGITYERGVIIRNIQRYGRDPVSNQPLSEINLRPNLAVKEAVELWKGNQ